MENDVKERIQEILKRVNAAKSKYLRGEVQYDYLAGYYEACLNQIDEIVNAK